MYEDYTHQAVPSKEYRELLGTALYVFNSNNSFVIENILKAAVTPEEKSRYDWYKLIDLTSGKLDLSPIRKIENGEEIANLFIDLRRKRDRIVHSFSITDTDGEQRLNTKDRENVQYVITEKYLKEFIALNDKLSDLLHDFRTTLMENK